ncbi:SDR family oxidoreductase [Rhodococcus sp. HM1]|uniref:SDR family oxidoreductase n=1 Tax=Rhodococcus rhodochrous TaxID=1829 RepID=A0AA46X0Q4_RHORH|nr:MULTISPECIES: SDR family oxidoreductase [Rhodococcus]MCB8913493.1 SDR family oxidoreductase [Rhodococcus rhodochrous]MCK8672082.1 SDR family oxidoreductase [Rhodococcus sp. HM1]UZF47966.1 SDR family oxidoreductase [Rhodococcus rhodochrous]
MDLGLKGKAFLVTGGSDGLGFATASSLVTEGADVTICARNSERLDDAVHSLCALGGGSAVGVRADVTIAADLDALVEQTHTQWGRLDGLVNSAGAHSGGAFEEITDDAWHADFDLKFLAAVRASRAAVPYLKESKGVILNVLSTGARAPGAGGGMPSSPLRAAGLSLTKALAGEFGPDGVRVVAMLVGIIRSGQIVRPAMEAGRDVEEYLAKVADRMKIPLGRVGEPHEFGDTAAFLLSPRAGYLTGTAVHVDGGFCPVI